MLDLLETLVAKATDITGAPAGYVFLANEERTVLVRVVATGIAKKYLGEKRLIRGGAIEKVWQSGEVLVVNDYKAWDFKVSPMDEFLEAIINLPLKANGETVG